MSKVAPKRKTTGPSPESLKQLEKKRRQVFKPVLDSPFTQAQWPIVDPAVSQTILGLLTVMLEPIGKHRELTRQNPTIKPESPEIINHVTLGFNSTVGSLERQAARKQLPSGSTNMKEGSHVEVHYVFVCRSDITPSLLTQHFPVLSFTSSSEHSQVKLVQLPKHSMKQLSDAIGMVHTGIIGLDRGFSGSSVLVKLVDENVENVFVPWLEEFSKYNSPNLKVLQTTAPIVKKNDQKKQNKSTKKGGQKQTE